MQCSDAARIIHREQEIQPIEPGRFRFLPRPACFLTALAASPGQIRAEFGQRTTMWLGLNFWNLEIFEYGILLGGWT